MSCNVTTPLGDCLHGRGTLLSFLFVFIGAAWPVTLGIGIGLGAGYSNCRHQFDWHGPYGPPFGRPHWGRPFWARRGKDGEKQVG